MESISCISLLLNYNTFMEYDPEHFSHSDLPYIHPLRKIIFSCPHPYFKRSAFLLLSSNSFFVFWMRVICQVCL